MQCKYAMQILLTINKLESTKMPKRSKTRSKTRSKPNKWLIHVRWTQRKYNLTWKQALIKAKNTYTGKLDPRVNKH